MRRKYQLKLAPHLLINSLLLLGIGAFDLHSAFAGGCVGYCKARQVRAFCHEAIRAKGLEGHQRDVEFERCKSDPMTHRHIEEIVDDQGQSSE